jgi:uncharacterized membrane protein
MAESRLTLLIDANKTVVPVFSRILSTDPGTIEIFPAQVVDRPGTVSGDDFTLVKGESVTREYILRRVKYDGPVNLAIDKNTTAITVVAPTQLTGFSQRTLLSPEVSDQRFSVTITMNANAVGAQIYPFTIRATAENTTVPVATTTTQVVAQEIQRSFSISAAPSAIALANTATDTGTSTSTIALTRTNFTGNIRLTASVPTGRGTANFGQQPTITLGTNSSDAAVTITAPRVTEITTYNVTVTATTEDPLASQITSVANIVVTVRPAPAPAKTIAIVANPSTISLNSAGTGTSTIALTRTNYTGNVTLTASVPDGRGAARFGQQPTITLGTNTSTAVLTITAPSVTTATTYDVTVTATSADTTGFIQPTVSTTISVTVQPSTISRTLTVDATSVRIDKPRTGAGSNSTPITITSNNLLAPVTLAAINVPTNVSAVFNSTNTTLTFTAQQSAIAGVYNITVRATSDQVQSDKIITLTIVDFVAPESSYTISATTPINIQKSSLQATTATSTISVTRTNLTEEIVLNTPIIRNSSNGTPAGLTVSFSSQTIGSLGTSIATISVAPSVPLGTYTIQIPSSAGSLRNTATIIVNLSPVSEWIECSTGNRRTDAIPTNYVVSTRANGAVCYEPGSPPPTPPPPPLPPPESGTVSFSGNLNFSFRRGTSQFATGETRTVTATNPSSTKVYQIALTTNPNITITPHTFRLERSSTATFTVRVTPQLLTALPDSPANVVNITAQITEI